MQGDVVTGFTGAARAGVPDDRELCCEMESLRRRCTKFGGIRSVKSCSQVPPTPLTDCQHICREGMPQERLPLLYIAQKAADAAFEVANKMARVKTIRIMGGLITSSYHV